MTLVIGVDGGGTHVRAVITDGDGREVARAESPGALVSIDAPGEAAQAVALAVHAAAGRGGVELPVDGMWAGLAGAGSREGRLAVARELEGAGLAERVVVGTDVEAAFYDAFGRGPGILLISGTGSIAWARDWAAEVIRVGGWGERLGDEGSGFAIGMSALRAVARAEDGRAPPTSLRDEILEHLSLDAADALIAWASRASKRDVAALVPLVARASSAEDAAASEILATAVADLTAHLRTVLTRAGDWSEPPHLVLWGGLLRAEGPLHEAMVAAAAAYPVQLMSAAVDPSMGAAKMALAALSETRGQA